MLKFFREYNKWILAVGVTLLMIAFLIQPTLNMFRPDPSSTVIGRINGDKVTVGDERHATNQLNALNTISPLLTQVARDPKTDNGGKPDGLRWILMLHEAHDMGLSYSQSEVNDLIRVIGLNDEMMARAAEQGGGQDVLRAALGNWAVLQQYQELLRGVRHVSAEERIKFYEQAIQALMQGYRDVGQEIISMADNRPRLSPPLLEHFIHDQNATVKVAAVVIKADHYLGKVPDPSPARLNELFNQYKDKLPGEGEPFGLGYKLPDRVKLEYLAIPMDRLSAAINLDEADAYEFYQKNKEQFRKQPVSADFAPIKAPGVQLSYEEARDQVMTQLKKQRAGELGDKMIKTAQAMLADNARSLAEKDGYREIPRDWQPMTLREVQSALQKQFGVLADVVRIDDRWLTGKDLQALPGIGQSVLMLGTGRSARMAPFPLYAMSAREIAGAKDSPFASLRLQAKLPGQALRSIDETRYLFRLGDARPARPPESLDEVKDQVVRDARRLAAYDMLKSEMPGWLERAKSGGLDAAAKEADAMVITPPAFPKRERQASEAGMPGVPDVSGIGQSSPFVDRVFVIADQARAGAGSKTAKIDAAPAAQRTGAVPVDSTTSLVVFRVDDYAPITKRQYDEQSRFMGADAALGDALRGTVTPDTLSTDAIAKRMNYVPANPAKKEEEKPEAKDLGVDLN